jgi:hypothetical protein
MEWQFGIGGRKPTRLFPEHESGVMRHKSTFSQLKAFWELMEYLIQSGHTHFNGTASLNARAETRWLQGKLQKILVPL